jgi:urea transport system ATP-binding protein
VLQLNKVNQYYGQSHTLWDIDLDLKKGECLCVMGRNGVGKTTLLKTIMGLLPVKSGSIEFNGTDFTTLAAEERARAGIGYVPQGREIFPLLSVEENLETGFQSVFTNSSRCCTKCAIVAVATCPADSNNSWRSVAP